MCNGNLGRGALRGVTAWKREEVEVASPLRSARGAKEQCRGELCCWMRQKIVTTKDKAGQHNQQHVDVLRGQWSEQVQWMPLDTASRNVQHFAPREA